MWLFYYINWDNLIIPEKSVLLGKTASGVFASSNYSCIWYNVPQNIDYNDVSEFELWSILFNDSQYLLLSYDT